MRPDYRRRHHHRVAAPSRPRVDELAYQWFSLDFLTNGRTIFVACQGEGALGGGRFFHEFEALGIQPKTRMRRMEEAIEIMRLTSREVNDASRTFEVSSTPAPPPSR